MTDFISRSDLRHIAKSMRHDAQKTMIHISSHVKC